MQTREDRRPASFGIGLEPDIAGSVELAEIRVAELVLGDDFAALHLALRVARPQATVIDLAFYQEEAAGLRLGAEFHHNGLAIRCAQIGRVPRGLAHSWDRERLSAETIGLLRAEGTAIREHLITAVVPFKEAPELFADLAARRRHELQAVLAFGSPTAESRSAAALGLEQRP